ncbi:paraquat-inducible protein A [Pseudomonas simiae]|uniref:paraquat-inducible protein A n=1 Tax=Pseudomonas simiae TaxID=321846 RepID=UPI0018E6F27A|nr:paraquat-inducible protein A [Pseudomonas simiae]MBJ2231063.1 paraquat-inducible protein A [Pseudomonas simiae]
MQQNSDWIICEHCDSVFEYVMLESGQTAFCTRCKGVLQQGSTFTIEQLFAISIASALLFVFANVFSVIDVSFQGVGNQAILWSSVWALAQGEVTPIAFVAGLCIILAPGLQIALLCWLLGFANRHRRAPGFERCMRLLVDLKPWSMLEVCLLGILVALIKLNGLLDVRPGLGLLALVLLCVVSIVVTNKSIEQLWGEARYV